MTNQQLIDAISCGMIDLTTIQAEIEMAERKKYLEGHKIYEDKNGKFYTRLSKNGKMVLVKRSTREAIEEEIISCEKEQLDRPTVKQVFERALEEKLRYKEISISTSQRYRRDYARFIKDQEIESMRFCELTQEYLSDFIKTTIADNELTSKGYANLRTVLRCMLIYAKGKYTQISAQSFFGDISFSKNTFKKNVICKEKQVFMEDEIRTLIQYLENVKKPHALGILLTFHTGIRVGELSALKKRDIVVDGDSTFLHIQRTETRYQTKEGCFVSEVIEYPKTSAGDRYVYCDEKATEILQKLSQKAAGYLFCNKNGRMNGGMFDKFLRRSCQKCGIPERSMHKIRKTYGTSLIDGGVDEAIIIEQMGHSDIHCTKQYYYFSNKNRDKKTQQLANALPF